LNDFAAQNAGRMTLARIAPGPTGFELRTFDCSQCDHVEKIAIALDPAKS
jgi:hypothetical protein